MITRIGATAIFLFVHVEKQGNDLFYRLVEWKKVCNIRVRSALSNHVSRVDEDVKSPNSPRNDRNDRSGKVVIAPY